MKDDFLEILVYVIIGVVGVIASAYQNKQRRKQAGARPPVRQVPRDILAGPEPEFGPDLGPLMEVLNIPRVHPQPQPEEETVESGPSVEEGGALIDTQEATAELEGIRIAEESKEGIDVPVTELYEEGQSDIQKMIEKYDAIRREMEKEYEGNEISSGEIRSVEEEAKQAASTVAGPFFEPRKAIIYSEILRRKEF